MVRGEPIMKMQLANACLDRTFYYFHCHQHAPERPTRYNEQRGGREVPSPTQIRSRMARPPYIYVSRGVLRMCIVSVLGLRVIQRFNAFGGTGVG